MKVLICDDGTPSAAEAARLGGGLAASAGADAIRVHIRSGDPVEQILTEATRGGFELIVIGSRGGRGLAQLFMGDISSRLAKRSPLPLLIVKGRRESIRNILVCTGGELPGETGAVWGGRVAAWTGASLTLLHVMSQLALSEKAPLTDLLATAEDAIAKGTREGKHLQRSAALAREAGARADVSPKLRHGLVLDEILDEVEAGDYDLVVIGAHRTAGDDPLRGLLLDDVADQIIHHCPRSVLVVRPK